MDIGTLLGIVACFGLIGTAMLLGGSLGAFIDVPSVCIVVGGTFAVTFIMYPMGTVFGAFRVMMKAFFAKTPNPLDLITRIVGLAELARKESLVALEKAEVPDPFLRKGVLMVADGTEEHLVRSILETEINFMKQRHRQGQGIFKSMGTMAPAFGMIGTLVGLVNMLQNLDDPSSIGPAMAVALLTTFYGAVLANVFFLPIATKLGERSSEDTLYMEIVVEGVIAILKGENPRIVNDKLEAYLAPVLRENDTP
ncbi:motility protein A [Desulfoplanes formicivorans]|uniref:Flagellar motor protein MotP n=1 Tax=Desulfoplanes formicivorans TaxID=1592317 RepID=A0A194AF64_9BACT|nr:MotA/TolQ/ExbB proton channel family protein [Desulfoplanes formicivorans]GAU07973.1 flagellar motor protein MotP [Desulfoplanes formicivorans]